MSTISNVGNTVDAAATYATAVVQPTTTQPVSTPQGKDTEDKDTTVNKTDGNGVVYESSKNDDASVTTKKTYTPNTDLIAKLKADAEARTEQLRSIVQKMMAGQGDAYGKANDMWQFLAGGNFTVDAATKLQAQKDIAEDGYWGVKQTSDRIIDFAKALTGGNPDKIDEMRSAFEKGFKQATKTWGRDLPSISSQTYDAVMSKFDDWKKEATTADQATATN